MQQKRKAPRVRYSKETRISLLGISELPCLVSDHYTRFSSFVQINSLRSGTSFHGQACVLGSVASLFSRGFLHGFLAVLGFSRKKSGRDGPRGATVKTSENALDVGLYARNHVEPSGGNKKPCVFPLSRLRFTLKAGAAKVGSAVSDGYGCTQMVVN